MENKILIIRRTTESIKCLWGVLSNALELFTILLYNLTPFSAGPHYIQSYFGLSIYFYIGSHTTLFRIILSNRLSGKVLVFTSSICQTLQSEMVVVAVLQQQSQ